MSERPEPDFTLDEVVQEMADKMLDALGLTEKSDPGLSTVEWSKIWGVRPSTGRQRIRALKERGLLIVGQRVTRDCTGRLSYVPVYRLKEEDKDESV